jgi:hypothetical protein
LLGQLQTADVNLRSGLHQHGMDALVRAHLERALAHIREATSRSTSKPKSARFRNWPTSSNRIEQMQADLRAEQKPADESQPQSMSDLCLNALPTVFLSAI